MKALNLHQIGAQMGESWCLNFTRISGFALFSSVLITADRGTKFAFPYLSIFYF